MQTYKVIVTGNYANIRSEQSANSTLVGKANYGDSFIGLKKLNDPTEWYMINYDGEWVYIKDSDSVKVE
jgi:hypothetical protein